MRRGIQVAILLALITLGACSVQAPRGDPLPSWNDGESKAAILAFVERITTEGSPDFVPAPQRIATFDNDGTLWAEQPVYFQALWALDRLRLMAPDHPEWKTTEPFKSALAGDMPGLMAGGMQGLMKVLLTAHSGITAEDFASSVRDWLATTRHPKTGMRFTEMIYQPMLELMDHLRAHDFKVFIVSGGGIDFLRVFSEEIYGIPPEHVVGTTGDVKFEMRNGIPTIVKEPKLTLLDDKAGKPVGIHRHIGRRPLFAAGNSDGDLQMLQYTTIPRGADDTTPRFGLLVHHTDGEREFAYDRASHIGKLDEALDMASQHGWVVVDMKNDWNRIHPASEH